MNDSNMGTAFFSSLGYFLDFISYFALLVLEDFSLLVGSRYSRPWSNNHTFKKPLHTLEYHFSTVSRMYLLNVSTDQGLLMFLVN